MSRSDVGTEILLARRPTIAAVGTALIVATLYLLPFWVIVSTAVRPSADVTLANLWTVPENPGLAAFGSAWMRISGGIFNSLVITIPAAFFSVLLGSAAGYVLAKWPFAGAGALFGLIVFGLFMPYQTVLIPLVRLWQAVGLYGTAAGLVLVHTVYGVSITTLIFRNYFRSLPSELLESARVDGASSLQAFRRIFLPLAGPAAIVAFVYQFTAIWNDFLFAVTLAPNPSAAPVTVGLANLSGTFVVEWNVVMAGTLVAALPTIIVYVLAGRYFVTGLMAGAVR